MILDKDEILLLEELRPPAGFKMESMLGCTYTMDPVLGLLLLANSCHDSPSMDEILTNTASNRERFRQIARENLPRTTFITDGHQPFYSLPTGMQLLLVEQIIHKNIPVDNEKGSFHPKLILIIYSDQKGAQIGKLYIGSKNLVPGGMKEFGVVLELIQNPSISNFNKSLRGFLNDLLEEECKTTPKHKLRGLREICIFLKNSNLSPKNPEIDLFWQSRHKKNVAFSLNEQLKPVLQKGWEETHLHSLWMRSTFLEWVLDHSKAKTAHVRCLLEKSCKYPDKRGEVNINYRFDDGLTKWHHKTILLKGKDKDLAIFGSANHTVRGFGFQPIHNTELLISWPCKKKALDGLKVIGSEIPDLPPIQKPTPLTLFEKVQKSLGELYIQVGYNNANKELFYKIEGKWNYPYKILMNHSFIESFGENIEIGHIFLNDKDISKTISLKIKDKDFRRLSSYVRFEVKINGQTAVMDQVIDLPEKFYLERLNNNSYDFFSLSIEEALTALLEIQGSAIPDANERNENDNDSKDSSSRISAIMSHLNLERLAFRIAKCKKNDPSLFKSRIGRIRLIVEDISKEEIKKNNKPDTQLSILRKALERIVNELEALPERLPA